VQGNSYIYIMDNIIIYKKNPKIVARKSGDEYILVPITDNVANMEAVYTMNETAAFIWENIDGTRSIEEIAGSLSDEYETDKDTAMADVIELIEDLQMHDIVTE
jgi:hypothetical protein